MFSDVAERIYEETGVEFPPDARKFDIYKHPRGRLSCQARIGYRGPVSPRGRNVPRIKFDLTADERVVLPGVRSRVFHPHSDEPEGGIAIRSYAYEEAFGEKMRVLAERARPRDLYDVINLFRNAESRPAAAVLLDDDGDEEADAEGSAQGLLLPLPPRPPKGKPTIRAPFHPAPTSSRRPRPMSRTGPGRPRASGQPTSKFSPSSPTDPCPARTFR